MPRNNEGLDGAYIEEVPGVSVPWRWAGVSRAGNRRSRPDNYFWTASNVRIEDDDVQGRKGLTKVNSGDSTDTSCVIGITDLPSFPTNGRFFIARGDDGVKNSHMYVPALDVANVKDVDPGLTVIDATYVIKYKGNIYTDTGKVITFRQINNELKATKGTPVIFPTPDTGSQMAVGPTLETDTTTLERRRDQEGDIVLDLYFISGNIPYRWDGNQSFPLAEATDIGSITAQHIGFLNEQLFIIADPAVEGDNDFYYRDFTGTWNAVAIPTLPLPSGAGAEEFVPQGWRFFEYEVLIHGYSTESGGLGTWYGTILVWDGSSLTLGTQTGRVGSSEITPSGIYDSAVYKGNYYYAYAVDITFAPYIGRYNGTIFSDTQIDASAFLSSGYSPVGIEGRGEEFLVTSFDYDNSGTGSDEVHVTTDLSSWTSLTLENAAAKEADHRVFII